MNKDALLREALRSIDHAQNTAKVCLPQTARDAIMEHQRVVIARITAAMEDEPEPVSRTYPCGCVFCICDDEERCRGCGAKNCGKPDDKCDYKQKSIRAALDAAALEDKSDGWIPVSERLPVPHEAEEIISLSVNNTQVIVPTIHFLDMHNLAERGEQSHWYRSWQPLPPLPKGE